MRAALSDVCVRVADDALSDADLLALVGALAGDAEVASLVFLTRCASHAPLLRRLVGPAGLPLALAKLLAVEGSSAPSREAAAHCLQGLVGSALKLGPPLATWAKPIIKPLRSAFGRDARGAAPGAAPSIVGEVLTLLSADHQLVSALTAGMPEFVAVVKGDVEQLFYAAQLIGVLASHPGARAAALQEGAVPALASLSSTAKKAHPSHLCKRGTGKRRPFCTLVHLSIYEDSRVAILATGAPSLLRGTLLGWPPTARSDPACRFSRRSTNSLPSLSSRRPRSSTRGRCLAWRNSHRTATSTSR